MTRAPALPPPAERGATVVADRVVRRIAERAATEAALPHGRAEVTRGAVTVRGRRADITVGVRLPYPAPLADTGAAVRDTVIGRVGHLTGLTVTRAAVQIRDLSADVDGRGRLNADSAGRAARPAAEDVLAEAGEARAKAAGEARAGRSWAPRRGPAAVVALVVAAGSGVLLADVVSVHAAGRRPAPWRLHVLDRVATHGPGDTAVAVGGAVVAVVGAWLVLLALTPGRRGLLTMAAPPVPYVRHVVLERSAAVRLVTDAVLEVTGVIAVRVRVGRRGVRVRARLGFGDPATARAQATTAALAAITALGLARTPRLRLRLTPTSRAAPAPDSAAAASNDGVPSKPPHPADSASPREPRTAEPVTSAPDPDRPPHPADSAPRTDRLGPADPADASRAADAASDTAAGGSNLEGPAT